MFSQIDVRPDDERLRRALFDHAPFGALLLSAQGRILSVNSAFARVVDGDPGELLGGDIFSMMPGHCLDALRSEWDDLLGRPGGSARFELPSVMQEGQRRWLECEAVNLLDDPSVGAILACCKDITERRHSERTAADVQARLNFLLSATDSLTYTCRPDGDYGATFMSPNVSEVLGYTAEEFTRSTELWANNIHPDDRERIFAELPRIFESGQHAHQYRFRHKDGSYRWMHDSLRLIRDDRGRPKEMIGYWVDISAQRETELALKRSEETFRTLFENLPVAALICRGETILHANPALVRMMRYDSLEEFRGRSVLSFIHPAEHAVLRARIDRLDAGGAAPPMERTAIRRDGTLLQAEAEGFSLPVDGELAYVILLRDVTDRKEMLARMAVADRMVSVGMLAAGVAHELNTPLAYVSSNLSLLLESVPRLLSNQSSRVPLSQVNTLLADCQDGVDRVVSVVRDLRTISKAEDSKRTPVELQSAIRSAIKMANNEIRHRAELFESIADGLRVEASEGKLVQLFLNLLMNAAQAIPEGRAEKNRIEITARGTATSVIIEVSDTGTGIAPDVLPRLFDPFFTTKLGVGTGLGLPICEGIVRGYGGELAIHSELQVGTRVSVTLPRHDPHNLASENRPTDGRARRRARVLVIDDEVRFGTTLRYLLAPDEVTATVDPREALREIERGTRFDAIVCDLMMPAMNGMDFYLELLRLDPASAGKVIFLTGGAFTQRSKEFLDSIQNPCLEKPASERALREAIDALVPNG